MLTQLAGAAAATLLARWLWEADAGSDESFFVGPDLNLSGALDS